LSFERYLDFLVVCLFKNSNVNVPLFHAEPLAMFRVILCVKLLWKMKASQSFVMLVTPRPWTQP